MDDNGPIIFLLGVFGFLLLLFVGQAGVDVYKVRVCRDTALEATKQVCETVKEVFAGPPDKK